MLYSVQIRHCSRAAGTNKFNMSYPRMANPRHIPLLVVAQNTILVHIKRENLSQQEDES